MDDPWSWDVERVVQELCTTYQTWGTSSATLKLPSLGHLEAALREHEVDGEVLLTYDQSELCAELGIKILKHKSTFKKIIQEIRLKSSQYRLYRKRQASEFEEEDVASNEPEVADVAQNVCSPDTADIQASDISLPEQMPRLQPDLPLTSVSPSSVVQSNQDQPAKKRRIAPLLVNTELDPNRNRNIATEADVVQHALALSAAPAEETVEHVIENPVSECYLGGKSTSRFDILNYGQLGRSGQLSEEEKAINFVSTSRLIPGKMIQTHRLMKRHLLRQARSELAPAAKPDVVRGANNPEHDKLLPLYGDSEDDMEYDSDTWREIEAEEVENANRKSRPSGLTTEEKMSNFERIIAQLAEEWATNKLPKYAGKANGIWREARRTGLKQALDRAQRELRDLRARIDDWKNTVVFTNDYRNVAELESSMGSFEPSVHDREYCTWLIEVLNSPSEPRKMLQSRAPRKAPTKTQHLPTEDDEETLTSDSEDGLGDFIVEDEVPEIPFADDADESGPYEHMDVDQQRDSGSPAESGDPSFSAPIPDEDPFIDSGPDNTPAKTPTKIKLIASQKDDQVFANPNTESVVDLTNPRGDIRRTIKLKDGKLSSSVGPSRPVGKKPRSPLIMGISDLEPVEQEVAMVMANTDQPYIDAIFSFANGRNPRTLFRDLILPAIGREWPVAPFNTHLKKESLATWTILRMFEIHKGNSRALRYFKNLDERGKQRLRDIFEQQAKPWSDFLSFLVRLSDRFEWTRLPLPKPQQSTPRDPTPAGPDEADQTTASDSSEGPDRLSGSGDVDSEGAHDAQAQPTSTEKKKKRKKVVRDRKAAAAREMDHKGAAEREARRLRLREKLETEGSAALGSQSGSIIINESKESDQGFVYVHPAIAPKIKEHQITGVRFMWDQLLVAKNRQGCLLAHTMGLGKTMQVITLLLTIGQAAASDDPTVSSQVPEKLRESRTLILCPASLVNNWDDEMTNWLPADHNLGEIYKVDSMCNKFQRKEIIQTWSKTGGIMIIGYSLFRMCFDDEEIRKIFVEWPNIVIADEAHLMKNPDTGVHMATSKFKTASRVALTGSPLANNVEEYYFMINWVAPHYLSDIAEFRARYANPIKEGLDVDSTDTQRRTALRMLRVLKTEVAPKVSRITIAVLKHDIPIKKEFVISVPLTDIQRKAYEMFIEYHSSSDKNVPLVAFHQLGLICASPSVFLNRLTAYKAEKDNGTDTSDKGEKVLPQQLVSNELTFLRRALRAPDAEADTLSLSWKMPILFRIVDECKKMGDCVLLFTHSKYVLNFLEVELRKRRVSFARLDGNTRMADRQGMVKDFNDGTTDLFLISTKAGGLGLNITGANRVIIFDSQFNPQDEQQAVGRAYRIGQQKPVFVYRLVSGGTFEERMLNQAIWKMQLASRVIDKKHPIKRAQRLKGGWQMPEDPPQEDVTKYLGKDRIMDLILRDEKYKGGIRSVQMMDVFEEEAVEEAELSKEDRDMADLLVKQNEARRAGMPIPGLPTPGLPASMMGGALGGTSYQYGPIPALNGVGLQPPPLPSMPTMPAMPAMPPSWGQPAPQPPHTVIPQGPAGSPQPTPGPPGPSHILPVQIPGAEVHIRSQAHPPSNLTDSSRVWHTLESMKDHLTQSFNKNASFPGHKLRSTAAEDLSSAVWENYRHDTGSREEREFAFSLLRAVSNERFVEAVAMNQLPASRLARMNAAEIDQEVKKLNEVEKSEWESHKALWKAERQTADPQHLQTALQRLTSGSNGNENSEQADASKSYRLDDREALQAVFERRRLQTRQRERNEGRRSASQSSDNNTSKEPRLPDWAKNLRKSAILPPSSASPSSTSAPSSSAPPRAPPPPPGPSHRPQSRTPFK